MTELLIVEGKSQLIARYLQVNYTTSQLIPEPFGVFLVKL